MPGKRKKLGLELGDLDSFCDILSSSFLLSIYILLWQGKGFRAHKPGAYVGPLAFLTFYLFFSSFIIILKFFPLLFMIQCIHTSHFFENG